MTNMTIRPLSSVPMVVLLIVCEYMHVQMFQIRVHWRRGLTCQPLFSGYQSMLILGCVHDVP